MQDATDTGATILAIYLRGDAELGRALHKSPRTIARWRALGEGPPVVKLGREILYPIAGVQTWLESKQVEQAA